MKGCLREITPPNTLPDVKKMGVLEYRDSLILQYNSLGLRHTHPVCPRAYGTLDRSASREVCMYRWRRKNRGIILILTTKRY